MVISDNMVNITLNYTKRSKMTDGTRQLSVVAGANEGGGISIDNQLNMLLSQLTGRSKASCCCSCKELFN